ncbi:hypothetical protein ACMFMG_011552 [Clarireedia jacksonii]
MTLRTPQSRDAPRGPRSIDRGTSFGPDRSQRSFRAPSFHPYALPSRNRREDSSMNVSHTRRDSMKGIDSEDLFQYRHRGQPGRTNSTFSFRSVGGTGRRIGSGPGTVELPKSGFALAPFDEGRTPVGTPDFWYEKDVNGVKSKTTSVNTFGMDNGKRPATGTTLYCDAESQTKPTKPHELYGKRKLPNQYKAGLVICAATHEPDYNLEAAEEHHRYRSNTVFGPVYSKERKYVLIQCYHDHAIALPIYTHGKKGLDSKPNFLKEQYISIRDIDVSPVAIRESCHDPIFTERLEEFCTPNVANFHIMHPKSSIHLVYPSCHKYSTPCIIEGEIRHQDLIRLIRLFAEYGPNNRLSGLARGSYNQWSRWHLAMICTGSFSLYK